MPSAKSLSIVLLAHNEAGIVESVVRRYYELMSRSMSRAVLIVCEDGSTDATPDILKRLQREIPFHLLRQEQRRGYGRALTEALAAAKTDLVFISDADGQHDPQDMLKLLSNLDGYDIVGGYKKFRRDPLSRIIFSRGLNALCSLLFFVRLRDIDCGFKVFRKRVIDAVLPSVNTLQYCVMAELILRAIEKGFHFKEIPVSHAARPAGKTTIFTVRALPGIIGHVFCGLLKIRREGAGKCA